MQVETCKQCELIVYQLSASDSIWRGNNLINNCVRLLFGIVCGLVDLFAFDVPSG